MASNEHLGLWDGESRKYTIFTHVEEEENRTRQYGGTDRGTA